MSLATEIVPAKEKGKTIFADNVHLDDDEQEDTFYLKLIVSTEEINSQLLELEAMKTWGK